MERDWSLERRDVLRAGVGATTVAALGPAASASESTTDAAYAPRGQVDVENAAEVVVTPDGDTAFVAVGSGFVSVDVSEPASPSVIGSAAGLEGPDGEGVREVLDVKYDDGQVLVPTGAQGGGPLGCYLFDVSDPANPTQVGDWFDTGHGNHNAVLLDGIAYLTGGLVLDVVDVSGASFERLGQWQPGDWKEDWSRLPNTVLHDLSVQGDRAYCAYWDAGVFVLDVSDPANPSFVARAGEYSLEEIRDLSRQAYLEPGGNAHYVTVNEDATLLAEGGESWDLDAEDDTGGPSGITFYDVSDETSPERVGHVDPPVSTSNAYQGGTWTTSHNFALANDRLYASWYQGGVTVHDVSNPAEPERLAWWAAPSDRAFWTARLAVPGEFFVASSHAGGGMSGNVQGGLLTFPDAAGEMAEAPTGVAWSEEALASQQPATTTDTATTDSGTTTAAATGGTRTTETVTEESTASTTSNDDESDERAATTGDDGSGSTPGFGVIAALAGLGVGASRLLRGRDDDDV